MKNDELKQEEKEKLKDLETLYELEQLYKMQSESRPSCKFEAIIFVGLILATLMGIINILSGYLSGSFGSIFGMGLK